MKPKTCILIALFISIVALIIKSVALSLPQFVDVHLVASLDEQSDSNRIAGVGVFQSEFDATDPALEEKLFEAGIPNIALDAPSLEFPLLFPSQENFFPEVLPANKRTLPGLLEAFPPNLAEEIENAIIPDVEAIEAIEFESCETFIPQMSQATIEYFTTFQTVLVPNTIATTQNSFKSETEAAIFDQALDPLFSQEENQFSFPIILGNFLPGAVARKAVEDGINPGPNGCAEGFPELDPDTVLVAENIACIRNIYNAISRDSLGNFTFFDLCNTVDRLLNAGEGDSCISDGLTIGECIIANGGAFFIEDTPLNEPAVFLTDGVHACNGNNPVNNFEVCGAGTKLDYLGRVTLSVLGISDELLKGNEEEVALGLALSRAGLGGALGLYVSILLGNDLLFSLDARISDRFNLWQFLEPAEVEIAQDDNFAQDFSAACNSLLAFVTVGLASGSLNLEGFEFDGQTCTTLSEYFPAVTDVLTALEEDLAPTVGAVSGIYTECFAAQDSGDLPNFNGACPTAFGFGLIEALLGGPDLVGECQDDVEDNEKIAAAQGFAIFSTLLEAISVVMTSVTPFLSDGKALYVAPISAFFAVIGGILIITALLVVQSAPVYAAVGGEPDGLEATFFTGIVGILAFIEAIMFFISAGLLCYATYLTYKSMSAQVVQSSNKEKEDRKEKEEERQSL